MNFLQSKLNTADTSELHNKGEKILKLYFTNLQMSIKPKHDLLISKANQATTNSYE